MKCINCGLEYTVEVVSRFHSGESKSGDATLRYDCYDFPINEVVKAYWNYARQVIEGHVEENRRIDIQYDPKTQIYTFTKEKGTYDNDCVYYRYNQVITFKFDDYGKIYILKEKEASK